MTSPLNRISLLEAASGLNKGHFSSVELTTAHLEQIAKLDGRLNSFVELDQKRALEMAALSDQRRAKKEARHMLDGLPISVKDVFCTSGIRTTACSKMLNNFVPKYESTITRKLLEAGYVMLGKTNCDEFAMGSGNLNSAFGPCINPWSKDTDLVPGGSSGGSAAAVSAFMSLASIGTDTGGSVRQPASYTGTVGIKPTYGRCSRFGMIAFASSLDQPGVIARNVSDAAAVLQSIMGFCEKDSTSVKLDVPDLLASVNQSVQGVKVGIPRELFDKKMDKQIKDMWERSIKLLEDQGVEIVDVDLKYLDYALAVYYIIASAEASSNLSRYDGVRYGHQHYSEDLDALYKLTRSEGFGAEVKRRIMLGTYVLSAGFMDAYYRKAQQVRSLVRNDFLQAFLKVDAILLPSAPSEAFPVEQGSNTDPVSMYLNDVFTVPISLAGLPALSLPVALSENKLPLGMQLVCKPFDEQMLIRLAHALERSVGQEFIPF